MKIITHYGIELELPDSAKWIAMDDDGFLFSYSIEPISEVNGEWILPDSFSGGVLTYIMVDVVGDIRWDESLREIKDEDCVHLPNLELL